MNNTDQRLETLELKLMELENSISELNSVVIRQGVEITTLQQFQQRILNQLELLDQRLPVSVSEPPPPRY